MIKQSGAIAMMMPKPLRLALFATAATLAPLLAVAAEPVPAPARPLAGPVAPVPDIRHAWIRGTTNLLQGEAAVGEWPLYLTAVEAGRSTSLQVAFTNGISVLPESSVVRVFVNDRLIGEFNQRGAEKAMVARLKVPPGTFVTGVNSLRIVTRAQHRVDCSKGATYELWTRIDPALTGALIPPGEPAQALRSLEDLHAIALSSSGTADIHLPLLDSLSAAEATTYARVIQAMVHDLQLPSPVVAGPDAADERSGIDLIVATRSELEANHIAVGTQDIQLEQGSRRPRLIVTGSDETAVGLNVETLVQQFGRMVVPGSVAGKRSLLNLAGRPIASGGTVTFGELGLDEPGFRGRRLTKTSTMMFPENFAAGSFEKVILHLKGAAPAGLVPGSYFAVRVNGVGAGSLRIDSDFTQDLEGRRLDIPFNLFHPGLNSLEVEAVTTMASDTVCESTDHPALAQFRLDRDASLDFPPFPNLRVGPDLSRAMGGASTDAAASLYPVHIVTPDAASIGATLTILANRATYRKTAVARIEFGRFDPASGNGLVVGSASDLPTELRGAIDLVASRASDVASDRLAPATSPARPQRSDATEAVEEPATALSLQVPVPGGAFDRLLSGAIREMHKLGFNFIDPSETSRLVFRDSSVLFTEVQGTSVRPRLAGVSLPLVTTSQGSWVLVVAKSNQLLADGIRQLVTRGNWDRIAGAATIYDIAADAAATTVASNHFYVVPANWTWWDVPLDLATIMSDHIKVYVVFLLTLMTVLGLLTMALVKRLGSQK